MGHPKSGVQWGCTGHGPGPSSVKAPKINNLKKYKFHVANEKA